MDNQPTQAQVEAYLTKICRDELNAGIDAEASITFKRGYYDGEASKGFKNPIHTNWPEGPHFNPNYERGYWLGYGQLASEETRKGA